jgi:hypothetical protein
LGLAAAQRYQDSRASGEWVRELRSELDVVPRLTTGRWKLSSRNRIECRDFESPLPDRWRYRNRLMVSRAFSSLGFAG